VGGFRWDDIRDVEGYRDRMTENRAKGMTGIWSLTPGQVQTANTAPLPPENGRYILEIDGREVDLREEGGVQVYEGDDLSVEQVGDDSYRLQAGGTKQELDGEGLGEELRDRLAYVPSMTDIVDSMEEFETAKAEGRGAISMSRTATVRVDDVEVEVTRDRMWDEATYQAAMTPVSLVQEVYEARPDQREELEAMYGERVVDRAMDVG